MNEARRFNPSFRRKPECIFSVGRKIKMGPGFRRDDVA